MSVATGGTLAAAVLRGFWTVLGAAHLAVLWFLRVVRVHLERRRVCEARKRAAKALQSLGAEVYALARLGERGDVLSAPAVRETLREAEAAEAAALSADEAAEALDARLRNRVRAVRERYEARRAALGPPPPATAPPSSPIAPSAPGAPPSPAREDRPELIPEDPGERR